MAKEEAKTEVATKAKAAKRSDEDLKKTLNGKLTIIVATAMALANEKGREGLTGIDKKDKEGAKQLSFKMSPVTSTTGTIATLTEKDPKMVALVDAAKKALPDINKSTFSPNVVALLNMCLTTLQPVKGVKRGFNPARLEGITL